MCRQIVKLLRIMQEITLHIAQKLLSTLQAMGFVYCFFVFASLSQAVRIRSHDGPLKLKPLIDYSVGLH